MATPTPTPTVQHVTKHSSDQLLSKFAQLDSHSPKIKRRKSIISLSRPSTSTALVERRSLLPSPATRPPTLLRQLRIARARLRPTHITNKSLLRVLEKKWRSTIEGASRVLMEKHYHRHKRLIDDIV